MTTYCAPLRMEVSLDLVHQEDDLPRRLDPLELAGGQVLLQATGHQGLVAGEQQRRRLAQRHLDGFSGGIPDFEVEYRRRQR